MTQREKYLYDLQGYLIVREFLTPAEVDELNAAIDAHSDQIVEAADGELSGSTTLVGERKRTNLAGFLTWPHPYCDPFRTLLAHPRLVPYLNEMLGRGWRMDHWPQLFHAWKGAEGLVLHGLGQSTFVGTAYYAYANGTMRSGMVALEYMLTDVNEGDGGFCIIPGSHKGNYSCPEEIKRWEVDQEVVHCPPCKAGDLVIFNEAAVHGTLPWTADHERRALQYRYSPKYLNWSSTGGFESYLPDWAEELTEEQRAVLLPPYAYDRPLIQDEGGLVQPRAEY